MMLYYVDDFGGLETVNWASSIALGLDGVQAALLQLLAGNPEKLAAHLPACQVLLGLAK